MSYIKEAIDSLASLMAIMTICLIIFVPLGLWKLIEIIIWLYHHVHLGIK